MAGGSRFQQKQQKRRQNGVLETNNEQNTVTPIFKEFVEEIAHLESRR